MRNPRKADFLGIHTLMPALCELRHLLAAKSLHRIILSTLQAGKAYGTLL